MLTRVLLGTLVAIAVVMVLMAVIAALAPYLAVGVVLFILWKVASLPAPRNGGDNSREIVIQPVSKQD